MVVGKEKTEEEGDRGKGCGWLRLPPVRLAGKAGTGEGGEVSNGWSRRNSSVLGAGTQ